MSSVDAFRPGERENDPRQRNTLFDCPIPLGHLVVLDAHENTATLYQHWRKVGRPEDYLRGYWDVPADVPPSIA